ncbi:MAG TPA: MarR family transcriptional regulator [Acidimicrobiales bacterium]|nr:MarR family transcriptional regulator [Acidimicrobiales bacterium]
MAAPTDLPTDARPVEDVQDDPHIEAFGMLIEAHNEVLHVTQRQLEATSDVPVAWLGVLIRLARSPGQRLRMSELARDMTMSTSGLTRLVDRIEAAGQVRREACPEDRRGFHAALTDEGRAALAGALPGHVADLERTIGGALDADELAELTRLLRRLRDHVRDSHPV